ncbi:hypothetical protein Trydic_g5419 [Trypoxylus dichotomus]
MRSNEESKSENEDITGRKEIVPRSNNLDALIQHEMEKNGIKQPHIQHYTTDQLLHDLLESEQMDKKRTDKITSTSEDHILDDLFCLFC